MRQQILNILKGIISDFFTFPLKEGAGPPAVAQAILRRAGLISNIMFR